MDGVSEGGQSVLRSQSCPSPVGDEEGATGQIRVTGPRRGPAFRVLALHGLVFRGLVFRGLAFHGLAFRGFAFRRLASLRSEGSLDLFYLLGPETVKSEEDQIHQPTGHLQLRFPMLPILTIREG